MCFVVSFEFSQIHHETAEIYVLDLNEPSKTHSIFDLQLPDAYFSLCYCF
jgi:hypothetical protein